MDNRCVVVIGSGPSGTMAALSLVQRGLPVILMESGLDRPAGLLLRAMGETIFRRIPYLDYSKEHVASADPEATWFYSLSPGGMSNQWVGAVPRFTPEDFYEGERLHESYRWPVSYEDLVPYYERCEQLLSVTGDPQPVPNLPPSHFTHKKELPREWKRITAPASAEGFGFTAIPLAEGGPWMAAGRGTFFNSFTQIVPLLQRFKHFRLLLGAHALRLEWSGEKKKVQSVVYLDRITNTEQRLNCAAVVLAAGAVASTKILLNSACNDFPGGLGDTEGILGQYLHDHIQQWSVIEVETPLPNLTHSAYLTRAPYAKSEPLLAASCTIRNITETKKDKILSRAPLKQKRFGVVTFGTMIPRESNYIQLNHNARDEFGFPAMDLHIRYEDKEVSSTQFTHKHLLQFFADAGYRASMGPVLTKAPGSSVHYGGTIRMHASPQYGVLNRWNRMYQIDNVAVVDASCFTTGAEKNPTLTAMALAARAGDKLAEDLKTA